MKKCVVIGSGLGGLSCGYILSKNGYDVTILEQGEQLGGCLQCFRRDGALFETGMHYIGASEPGQSLNTIWHYLGLNKNVELQRLNPYGYDVISFKGEHYNFANGKEEFVNSLATHFPNSRDELNNYYDLIKLVASSSAMHSLSNDIDININAEYQLRSVNEVVNKTISDPILRDVLVGNLILYAGVKDKTPFSTHALINDSFLQSAFRIVGGSCKVAESLVTSIKNMGGRVLNRNKVNKIECDASQATAVITTDGERYPADIVISAIHPSRTLDLVESTLIRPAYRRRIENFSNTPSVFTVYLKFKKNSLKYMDSNLYYYRHDIWGCEDYSSSSWPKSLLYMHFCHEKNPLFAESGEIMTYMNYDDVKSWIGTKVGHRGISYEEFKKEKAERIIDVLAEEIPDIRSHIERYYTSTPLTYIDYTDAPEGAMYGVLKDVQAPGTGYISCRTKIPNLLLTGQSITSHGMFGVLAGSLITCEELLTRETLFSQLKSNQ